ncbi:GNAT family N-acetyltransferase [Salinicoccus halodurans]|uniref:ElaA protein n=1 Tax=Salinicoccus halodurans TaxID=407035 RepID=A0A0F7HJZ0_9STAP|nr:GNAT family N-acetyltransferase [Salinicoccus halodurans]AKG73429.1 hypothetical protein AAT16_03870 [Salinicoccus halodurans]SFK50390.1 ElaA protein [Salinicoccus halodurans]
MWQTKKFNELSLSEIEQIFRLRQSIFIIEQQSYFADIDGKDTEAIHIFNKENNIIWAYCRILIYDEKVILGRVTVHSDKRGNGNGRELLNTALKYLKENYPDKFVQIVAMSYLKDFYKSYGFKSISEVYIMDDHPHEDMILKH